MYINVLFYFLTKMSIGDWTSNRWVTCFSDLAEQLLGRSAQEIGDVMENNPTEAEEIFSSINFHSYMFKLRSKVETYGVSIMVRMRFSIPLIIFCFCRI